MTSFSKITTLAFAIVLPAIVSAQTFSTCNPMVNTTCPPNPALCADFESDFTQGASALSGWKTTAGSVNYSSDGALFTLAKKGDAPTIQTDGYAMFGYYEITMKAATGTGIISSIVLQSEDLDEVDWEFIGGNNAQVQTNYFGKGNTTTFDRMIPYNVATPQDTFHTYAVNWTSSSLVWLIDNTAVRTVNFADAVGGKNFPQTPMNLRLGIWAGGDPSNSAGTIEWAGGETDYSKAPFTMTVKSIKVQNYNSGKEYVWEDQSGSFESIKTVAGTCGESSSSSGSDSSASPSGVPASFFPIGGSEGTAAATGAATQNTGLAVATSSVPSSIIVDTASPTTTPSGSLLAGAGNSTAATATTSSKGASAFSGAAVAVVDAKKPAALALAGVFGMAAALL